MTDTRLHLGDALTFPRSLDAGCLDCIATDPPYDLTANKRGGSGPASVNLRHPGGRARITTGGFMGKEWDATGVAFRPETWAAAAEAVKPGGYLLSFGGTRTYHRLTCAIEDAGWEIRDCIIWLYATGFPKAKSCLKPSYEPVVVARKPGPRVLPLGIDECRVPCDWSSDPTRRGWQGTAISDGGMFNISGVKNKNGSGRWPANLAHDGSDEVMGAFEAFGEKEPPGGPKKTYGSGGLYGMGSAGAPGTVYLDTGTAARFFYTAKASRSERGEGNDHPTVKPLSLMEWLVKLVCHAGGTVGDFFLGSGTTAVACVNTGRNFVGCEKNPDYLSIAERRVAAAQAARAELLIA